MIFLDYFANLSSQADANGSLASVSLRLPAGMRIPAAVRVYIILDVYPAAERTFGN